MQLDGSILASDVEFITTDLAFISGRILALNPASGPVQTVTLWVGETGGGASGLVDTVQTVDVSSVTTYDICFFNNSWFSPNNLFGSSSMLVGQRILIGGTFGNSTFTPHLISLRRQGVYGTVVPGSVVVTSGNAGTFKLLNTGLRCLSLGGPLTVNTGAGTLFFQGNSDTLTLTDLQTASATTSVPVVARGLVLKDSVGGAVLCEKCSSSNSADVDSAVTNPAFSFLQRVMPSVSGSRRLRVPGFIINSIMKKVVHAACPHDCPDACGVLITVQDGRATKIQGDPTHPVTRGFLCAKVAKYLDRVYSPDRVLYPMRRVGPKGLPAEEGARATQANEAFERISWDEALDEVISRFRKIVSEFGSEAILPYSYGGTLGALNGASMDRRFFHRLGASQLARNICSAAGEAGLKSVIGIKLGTEPEQFRYSRYIIAWGANIHGNNVHLWPFIAEARRQGAKLVVIDPYRTRTAACADWYLPINPGTDAALALGLMHVIINESLHDADYVARYTVGFDQLREKVHEYSPEPVARWTGISASDIVKLARGYATTRPAVIRVNYGVQRSEGGGMATRSIAMLPCITGSWKEIGGGLQLSTSGAFGLNKDSLERADLMQKALGRPARTVNMVALGTALNTLDDPPVKALFVYNSNPAAVCPNHNAVIRGLQRPDLFTVVHEQFFTDTTDYADIVLPATTFFEHKDLQPAYGHYYLQMSDPAIAPLGECRSNVEVFRGLAERMSFQEDCFRESVDQMIDAALNSENPRLQGIGRDRLEREGHVRLSLEKQFPDPGSSDFYLPFAQGSFATASGKAELYSEEVKAQGLDPVAVFDPPRESRHSPQAREFPLELLARKADNFLNSTFCNVAAAQQMEEAGLVEMNAADAQARKIADGDLVRVFNRRGDIHLRARVDDAVQTGVVSAKLHWAKLSLESRNINVLTSEKLTDLGNSATFYSVLVEVELAKSSSREGTSALDGLHGSTV